MGDRDIIVFGSCAGESNRRQYQASEEDEIFRLIWRNSERRKAEERQRNDPRRERLVRIARTVMCLMAAFFASLGIYMFLALIL